MGKISSVNILYDTSIYGLDDPMSIGLFTHVIDSQDLMHSHSYWEFFYMIRGTAAHHIEDSMQWLLPGKIYLIKPGVKHALVDYHKDHTAVHRDICVSDALLQKIAASVPEIMNFLNDGGVAYANFPLSNSAQSFFEDKLNFFNCCTPEQQAETAPFIVKTVLLQVLQELFSSPRAMYDKKFERILAITQEKAVIEKGLPELVRLSSYSRSQLHRLFIKNTGKSPLQVITDFRMETAAMLLTMTDEPLYIIAENSGYDSVSRFTKVFKKYYMLSPHKYRLAQSKLIAV